MVGRAGVAAVLGIVVVRYARVNASIAGGGLVAPATDPYPRVNANCGGGCSVASPPLPYERT